MPKAVIKLLILIVILIVLASILFISIADAQYRGKMTYCRNNLRGLGYLAAYYIRDNRDEKIPFRGREFWLEVVVGRDPVTQERIIKGSEWEKARQQGLDMLVCPVLGKTESRYGDVKFVDYRGPANDPATYKNDDVFGSDRELNHGADGCNILFIDLTVRDVKEGVIVHQHNEAGIREKTLLTTAE